MDLPKKQTQVAVIGAGPGGYGAAFRAADLGLDVTLIDLDPNPGGTCLYRGCIPSKALLHAARVISEAREAEHWGIRFGKPAIDLERLREATNGVVEKLTSGLGQLCRARKITRLQGRAGFIDSRAVRVHLANGDSQELAFDYAVLATGSRPATVPGLDLESPAVWNSTDALKLERAPKTMLVVGGGYIGLELGTVYAALGSEVTIVEMTSSLLPGVDADLVRPVAERMKSLCKEVLLNTRVTGMEKTRGGVRVTLKGEGVTNAERTFERVLVCVGRKPNSSGLGLDSTKVKVDDQGFVVVDKQLRTSEPHIFAIGDLIGQPMLAHKATHEGRVVAEVIAGHNVAFDARAIPAVVFTDPEVAWCGLTEGEAKKNGRAVNVARYSWGASSRAATLNRSDGLTKLITDAETHEVLGIGITGPGAGELIAEGALAIEMGALASDLELVIHPHPTLSETVMESAELIFGSSTHVYRPKKT